MDIRMTGIQHFVLKECITRKEFKPVRAICYGFVAAILLGVMAFAVDITLSQLTAYAAK